MQVGENVSGSLFVKEVRLVLGKVAPEHNEVPRHEEVSCT